MSVVSITPGNTFLIPNDARTASVLHIGGGNVTLDNGAVILRTTRNREDRCNHDTDAVRHGCAGAGQFDSRCRSCRKPSEHIRTLVRQPKAVIILIQDWKGWSPSIRRRVVACRTES